MHTRFCRTSIKKPTRWIGSFKGHKLQRYGKVNQVKIQILQTQIFQRPFQRRLDMIGTMVSVPKFRSNPKIFPCAKTFAYGPVNTLAGFFFIAIVTGTVQVAVTGADGFTLARMANLLSPNLMTGRMRKRRSFIQDPPIPVAMSWIFQMTVITGSWLVAGSLPTFMGPGIITN